MVHDFGYRLPGATMKEINVDTKTLDEKRSW